MAGMRRGPPVRSRCPIPSPVAAGLLAGAALLAGVGCDPLRYVTPERLDRGLVIVVPGMGGAGWEAHSLMDGLADGGVGSAIELFDWGVPSPLPTLADLTDLDRNRLKAAELAERIVEYRAAKPGRPVRLVGHSAGAGVLVFALEALPPGVTVDRAVLLAAALSADYDLAPALARVPGGVVSFHSAGDWVVSIGTAVFGTVDRRHAVSGGYGGFEPPPEDADPHRRRMYERLEQVPWRPAMVMSLNVGGHHDQTYRPFVSRWVAPRLLASPKPEPSAGR
jgi:hypothetical protein